MTDEDVYVSPEQLLAQLRRWQRRLHLQQWSITLDSWLTRPGDERDGEPHATTDIRTAERFREAAVYMTRMQPQPVLDWVLVRELLGAVLWPLHEVAARAVAARPAEQRAAGEQQLRVAEEEVAQQLTQAIMNQPETPYAIAGWFNELKGHAREGTEPEA